MIHKAIFSGSSSLSTVHGYLASFLARYAETPLLEKSISLILQEKPNETSKGALFVLVVSMGLRATEISKALVK